MLRSTCKCSRRWPRQAECGTRPHYSSTPNPLHPEPYQPSTPNRGAPTLVDCTPPPLSSTTLCASCRPHLASHIRWRRQAKCGTRPHSSPSTSSLLHPHPFLPYTLILDPETLNGSRNAQLDPETFNAQEYTMTCKCSRRRMRQAKCGTRPHSSPSIATGHPPS